MVPGVLSVGAARLVPSLWIMAKWWKLLPFLLFLSRQLLKAQVQLAVVELEAIEVQLE